MLNHIKEACNVLISQDSELRDRVQEARECPSQLVPNTRAFLAILEGVAQVLKDM
jgi:hypothetical protein